MADPNPSTLRVWEGWQPAPSPGWAETAEKLYGCETLGCANPARETAEAFSLQWFLGAENARHHRYGKWLPRLLEFAKHNGERLLGLGYGLGTDWVQYARHGAEVIACSPSAEHLAIVQRNFELRGLHGRLIHAHPAKLPVETASIDVACVNNLLHQWCEPQPVVEELFRVLKPGGKVLALTPSRYDVEFWARCFFPWRHWQRPRGCGATLFGTGAACYSASGLRRLFAAFVDHRVYKRHLRRGDVPHLWRLVPLGVLERILGRVLIIKAFKPLSAARTLQAAA
jgi:SAM-dependent methyltransferase